MKHFRYSAIIFVLWAMLSGFFVYPAYSADPQYAPTTSESGLLQEIKAQNEALAGTEGAKLGGGNTDPRYIIASLIKLFFGFVGTLALIYTTYGGYLYLTSAGSDERVEHGRKAILYGIFGIAIVLSSYSIIWFMYKLYFRSINNPFTTQGIDVPGSGGKYIKPEPQTMYKPDPLGPGQGKNDIVPAETLNLFFD